MSKRRLILLFTFFIIILFLFTFNVTSSRYIGQIEGKVEDINAIPILNLNNPVLNKNVVDMLPGFIDESDFYVSNYDDTNTNEVLMKYYIKVQTTDTIPVKIHLTDENGTEMPLDNEGKTQEIELPYSRQIKNKYHIKIEWDEKNNDYKYAGKDLKLTIEIVATQVV